ncbi:hypothetical protein BU17DRAFT_60418 [Hysterangium stoloniferum]|nr:hypothetical protein BU17DRAFT_60418 [Hysterangium stoloniferum]
MSGPSSLASIVNTSTVASWVKLALDEPLALFHTKFWGTSMKDGMHGAKRTAKVHRTSSKWTWTTMEKLTSFLAAILLGSASSDSYHLSGSVLSILKTYDKAIPLSKITGRPPSFVMTGQPGIGKTLWQIYAAHCASVKRPFLWLYRNRYTLLVEEGAYKLPASWQLDDFLPSSRVWVFIDSESDPGALARLTPVGTQLVVFFTTSSSEQRWHRLHKTTLDYCFIMNPWGIGEIKRAASLYNVSEEEVLEKYDRLGPIPRLCIEYDAVQLQEYEVKLLTNRKEDQFHLPVVAPVSRYIKTRLANQFRKEELKEKILLYCHFEKVPLSRTVAGIFFEAAVQTHLTTEISLTLYPMVKQESDGLMKNLPRWSSHMSPELERLYIKPTQTIEYLEYELNTILPDVFYVPERSNQVIIDSFILSNGKLYLFQFTIAKNDPIKSGITNYAAKRGFPKQEDWRFVFIIPPALTLTIPQQPADKEVHLYTAVVDVTKFKF